jgi:hypothetical protein
MRGAAAPILLIKDILTWSDVRGHATSVVGELQSGADGVDYHWRGHAASAYLAVIPTHSAASARIAVIADRTQAVLGLSVSAALTFYVGLLAVVMQFLIGFAGVLAALGSVVFSWAGVALAIEKAKIGFLEIATLFLMLAAALGAQVAQLGSLHGEAADASSFPGGHWPGSLTDRYSDATVTDGDAEWSIER